MPKSIQPSASEQERYQKIARDMFRDDGRPKVSTIARKLMGRIIRWRDGDHFGFISSGDGTDVYVHESEVSESLCKAEEKVGFLVQFDLVARETFNRIASAELGNQRQKSARSVQLLAEPDLIGRLTWKDTFGFIKCADGNEYFCTERDFLKEGLSLDTGAVVQFLGVSVNDGKRLRAMRISPSDLALPVVEAPMAQFDVKQITKTHTVQTALDGRIVKLNEDKNFGFIRSKVEGNDIYFKINEQTGSLYMGAEVLFSLQDTEGSLSAFDVTVIGRPKSELVSDPRSEPKSKLRAQNPRSRELTGLVTSWSEEKGYGFITPDHEDGVVFAHSGDVGNLKRGTRVTFTAVETLKGKKAIDVSSTRHVRAICRNPACQGAHFVDNCPLNKVVKKAVDSDDAASEGTCSTAATTAPCPSRRTLPMPGQQVPGLDDRCRMRRHGR